MELLTKILELITAVICLGTAMAEPSGNGGDDGEGDEHEDDAKAKVVAARVFPTLRP